MESTLLTFLFVICIVIAIGFFHDFQKTKENLETHNKDLAKQNWALQQKFQLAEKNVEKVTITTQQEIRKKDKEVQKKLSALRHESGEKNRQAKKDADIWKASLKEKSAGFPTLFSAIELYEAARDDKNEKQLREQKRPALKAAERIKEEARRRREAEYENRKTQSIIEYYENIAPFLIEYKNEIIDDDSQSQEYLRDYTDDEKSDEVTRFLVKSEYRALSPLERNQLALDRYWDKWKTKKEIGRLYECFVGFLYEAKGYDVEYFGNIKGFEDLGRDLICKKGDEVIIIQCKNWSTFKTIFEKHIFQFFGTVFQYKQTYPEKSVNGKFYTSTNLSDLALSFANEFNIEIIEEFPLERFPCIKGNISRRNNEKIYHLPFDQQYDKVKIEPNKGEKFFQTVKEAENEGFRRAKRWIGDNDSSI